MFEGLKNTKILQDVGIIVNSYTGLEKVNIFLFSFRMPLFFMISGLFIHSTLERKGLKIFVSNRIRTILYPYFLWGTIQITIAFLFSSYTNSDGSFSAIKYLFYSPRHVAQFWYLYALFNVGVLFAFIQVQLGPKGVQQVVLGLIFFLLSTIFYRYQIDLGFVNDILHYYLFLAIGVFFSKSMLKGEMKTFFFSKKSILWLIVPFVLSQYYFLAINLAHRAESPKYLFVEYNQPVAYLLIALVGCGFVIAVSSMLERFNAAKWLRYLGTHSLHIYVMHVIVFAAVRILMTNLFHIYDVYLLMIVCISAGLVIPVLFYNLTERIGLRFLFTLEKKERPSENPSIKKSNLIQVPYEKQNNKFKVT